MEVPLAALIVMAVIPPFEGHEADTRTPCTAVLAQFCVYKRGNRPTAGESGCASARTGGRPRTRHQVRALPEQPPKLQARCVSMDRGNGRMRGISQPPPATRPRLGSTNLPEAAPRRSWPLIEGPCGPEEASSGSLRCHVEPLEPLLPRAGIRVRFPANPPEMSRKAVAQEIPFSGYRYPENFKTLERGSGKPLFRGVWLLSHLKVGTQSLLFLIGPVGNWPETTSPACTS
jgi:hypothetical protein